MIQLSLETIKERGWFYKGKIKYFYRDCDYCGNHYEGQGSKYCSYTCTRLFSPIVMKGELNPSKRIEVREKISKALMGRPMNPETQKAIIKSHKGFYGAEARNGRWKGEGKRANYEIYRGRNEWRDLRNSVFQRDNFTCRECEIRGGHLECHHILPVRTNPELVYDINNGITLCRKCHVKTIFKEFDFVEKYRNMLTQ